MDYKCTNLEELKSNSVRLYDGMIVVCPQLSYKEEPLHMHFDVATLNGRTYALNNGTLAFTADGDLFATPATRAALTLLNNEGYKGHAFYVPFSNWDYPKKEKAKWERLRQHQRQAYREEFMEDCMMHCDKKGYKSIPQELLEKCLEMPSPGVPVEHLGYHNTYYPVITSLVLDIVSQNLLGTFCRNNGKVVFVYRDGKTYVCPSYSIIHYLQDAGFREKGLFVPFSNQETILDPDVSARWDYLREWWMQNRKKYK